MSYLDEYRRKLVSAEEAAGLVKPGMNIDYGSVAGFPLLIDEKLAVTVFVQVDGIDEGIAAVNSLDVDPKAHRRIRKTADEAISDVRKTKNKTVCDRGNVGSVGGQRKRKVGR